MPSISGAGGDTAADLRARLEGPRPLLLDGATGTELEARGVDCGAPLWSARVLLGDPAPLLAIHRGYVAAGVDLLTANTFRTQARSLARAGISAKRAGPLTRLAVELARQAALDADRPIWVAGSAPPLEDCYRPDLVPADVALEAEHAAHAHALLEAGADSILVETINCVREGVAAARAAAATGLPFVVSFVSWQPGRLLSGERLRDAIAAVAPSGPLAIGVNCLPPSAVAGALAELQSAPCPFAIYANLGPPPQRRGETRGEDCDPETFAAHVCSWHAAGARLVGGCCGTTPAHLAAAATALSRVAP